MIYWIIHYLVRILLLRSTQAMVDAQRQPYAQRRSGGTAGLPIASIVVNPWRHFHRVKSFAQPGSGESRRLKVSVNTNRIWATNNERGNARR